MDVSALEKNFYTIEQLKKVSVRDNGEVLVDIHDYDSTIILETRPDNIPYTGDSIYVRENVARKLKSIQSELVAQGLGLKITDGYRPIEVQEQYWNWRLGKDRREHPEFSEEELENYSIKFTAKPEYAYHPTGGAVDVTLIDLHTHTEVDMGTPIDHFSEEAYSHFPNLPQEVLKNRKLLFDLMEQLEFYNFPSEWWHFSYGTLDWALCYKKPHAIYGPVEFHI